MLDCIFLCFWILLSVKIEWWNYSFENFCILSRKLKCWLRRGMPAAKNLTLTWMNSNKFFFFINGAMCVFSSFCSPHNHKTVSYLPVVWNPTYLLTFMFCLLTLSCFVQSVLDRTFTFHYCFFYFTNIFVIILWYFINRLCFARLRYMCSTTHILFFSFFRVLSSHHRLRPDINTAFEWRIFVSVSECLCVCCSESIDPTPSTLPFFLPPRAKMHHFKFSSLILLNLFFSLATHPHTLHAVLGDYPGRPSVFIILSNEPG